MHDLLSSLICIIFQIHIADLPLQYIQIMARACLSNVSLIFNCPQTEMEKYLANLRGTCDQHVQFPSHCSVSRPDYATNQ